MKIASAQINCKVGEIENNLNLHYRAISTAIENHVQLISFPEMSITGYCREEGNSLALTQDDPHLDRLKKLSSEGNLIIIAGAPIKVNENLYIGSFIIYPDGSVNIYTKQYLHGKEELFYSSSMDYNPIISLEDENIALAICADINNANHPSQAQQNKCTTYLPSIFFEKDEMDRAHATLKEYAQKHSLNILMSNYSGEHWNLSSGGRSAFWNSKGEIIGSLDHDQESILIAEKHNDIWSTKNIL